jgi:tetratricopeptide (TPR) repeat protein
MKTTSHDQLTVSGLVEIVARLGRDARVSNVRTIIDQWSGISTSELENVLAEVPSDEPLSACVLLVAIADREAREVVRSADLVDAAVRATDAGRIAIADELFREAYGLAITPELLVLHANNLLELNLVDEAQKMAFEATQHAPDDSEAWFVLGRAMTILRNWIEATRAFEHSLKLDPTSAVTRGELARILIYLARREPDLDRSIVAVATRDDTLELLRRAQQLLAICIGGGDRPTNGLRRG